MTSTNESFGRSDERYRGASSVDGSVEGPDVEGHQLATTGDIGSESIRQRAIEDADLTPALRRATDDGEADEPSIPGLRRARR
jgi:hypothetical protein